MTTAPEKLTVRFTAYDHAVIETPYEECTETVEYVRAPSYAEGYAQALEDAATYCRGKSNDYKQAYLRGFGGKFKDTSNAFAVAADEIESHNTIRALKETSND